MKLQNELVKDTGWIPSVQTFLVKQKSEHYLSSQEKIAEKEQIFTEIYFDRRCPVTLFYLVRFEKLLRTLIFQAKQVRLI